VFIIYSPDGTNVYDVRESDGEFEGVGYV